jgi:putative ABC transport system permease protein
MNFKDILITANSNLFRSKLRTILTILAIFIGSFTLTLTSGLGAGISQYVNSQVSNLGATNSISVTAKSDSSGPTDTPQKYTPGQLTTSISGPRGGGGLSVALLTSKDVATLKANKDLDNVTPVRAISPAYIKGAAADKYKVSQSQGSVGSVLDLASGSNLDLSNAQPQLILPISYVPVLGYSSNEDAIGKTVTIGIADNNDEVHEVNATIVGVQNKGLTGSSSITTNYVLTDALYNEQSIGLSVARQSQYASVTATYNKNLTDAQVSDLRTTLSNEGYTMTTLADALGTFQTVLSAIVYVLDAFAVITLLAASFGIINTLLMSVQERTKEIGLMKAMGMANGRIFALFSLEAILIGFWGSFIGVLGAMGIGTLVNKIASATLLKDLPGFTLLKFPITNTLVIVGLIMLIAFLAGALPARKASKQSPIDALKYE